MIPIRDFVPRDAALTSRRAIVTGGLILLTLVLFLLELRLQTRGSLTDFLQTWGVVPGRLSAMMAEIRSGTWLALPFMLAALIVGIFLQGSFAQLLGNSLFLWVFGRRVEERLGSAWFLGVYLLGGLVTTAIQVVMAQREAVLMGSNGAIATLLGVYFAHFSSARVESILPLGLLYLPIDLPASFYLFCWFAQQISYGIGNLDIHSQVNPISSGYVSQFAGLLLGLLWGYVFRQKFTAGI